jgi:processing peptidase subunit alpha
MATVQATGAKDPAELDSITTLSNGVRVATEALPGHFSAVGVYIEAGSRFENSYLSGASHITDRIAYKSTTKRDADQMVERIEMLGGNIHCASSRESIMYQGATFNSAIPDTVALLAETIRDPLITEDEVNQQLETADYEITEIWDRSDLILPELLHVAAYQGNTLGNPLLAMKERLPHINRRVLDAYRQSLYIPERMVVAFAGVAHEEAVHLAQKWFGDMQRGKGLVLPESTSPSEYQARLSPISSNFSLNNSLQPPNHQGFLSKVPFIKNLSTSASKAASIISDSLSFEAPSLTATAQYTGGYVSIPGVPSMNPNIPPLTHIHLAFEAPPITSNDIYAVAVLQTLLGGGGSFSAGGPGKGMYSRLYTNVLNQHGWVENCMAFNHGYSDSGLFGISAICVPATANRMLDIMCRELKNLASTMGSGRLQQGEVNRAKNQLRSMLLMNLESRMTQLEDLGRQIQTHGRRIGVNEMCQNIDAVTIDELRRVAGTIISGDVQTPGKGSGAPTVIVREDGEEKSSLRGWGDIQEIIHKWGLGRQ